MMKRKYMNPVAKVYGVKSRSVLLAGSGQDISVNNYNNAGEETVTSSSDW